MKVQLFICFFIVLVTHSSGDQHYCGRILSETLNHLCEQEYPVKRTLSAYNEPQRFGSHSELQGFGNNGEITLKRSIPSFKVQHSGYPFSSYNGLQGFDNNGQFSLKTAVSNFRIQTSGKGGHFMKNSVQNILGLEGYGNSMPSQEGWPGIGQQNALALNSPRGKRQGVADECCLKACSLDELLSYC